MTARGSPPPMLLDGAMGTQIQARGARMEPPLFSASALVEVPELVVEIHCDYMRAGARVITTNSFFTHRHNLRGTELEARAAELTTSSVVLARRARDSDPSFADVRIAGSVSPLVGGQHVPDPAEAEAEYGSTIAALIEGGCDLLLLESMTRIDALAAALAAAKQWSGELWISHVPRPAASATEQGPGLLESGTTADLVAAAIDAGAAALLANCCALDDVPPALSALDEATREHPRIQLGAYPHVSGTNADGDFVPTAHDPEALACAASAWRTTHPRLSILGACCGSSPEHIAALSRRLG